MYSVPPSLEAKSARRFPAVQPRYRRKKTKSGLVILIRMMAKARQIGMSTMIAERMGYELN